MDLKIITKNLNKESLNAIKDTLGKINPIMRKRLISWAMHYPRYVKNFSPLYKSYNQAKITRKRELKNGLQVPPALIISITPRCNLNCVGCYAFTAGNVRNHENSKNKIHQKALLNYEQWYKIFKESRELGIFCNIIAGGEPFLFPELINLCKEFQDQTFVIFTNGTTLNESDYNLLKQSTNLAVIVSMEGDLESTDRRRGVGVYKKALNTIKSLNQIGVPTGISATITRRNFKYWINSDNIDNLIKEHIKILFLIEYIPTTPLPQQKLEKTTTNVEKSLYDITSTEFTGTDHSLLLTFEERREFRSQIIKFRTTKPIFIIHSPGDEELLGGCVSAGRGFAHITPAGDLTPCPVSNIATHNLASSTLREGLASPLFKEICKNEHLLETDGTPCALFAHPDEVNKLAELVGAYRTDLDTL